MKETINTNMYELLDAGSYTFAVENVERIEKGTIVFYKFTFVYVKNGNRSVWTTILFRSNMSDILRFTGMSETTPGYFELDYEAIKGKMFSCKVVHEMDKKGTMREKIIGVEAVVESVNPDGVKDPNNISWEN